MVCVLVGIGLTAYIGGLGAIIVAKTDKMAAIAVTISFAGSILALLAGMGLQ